jgi:hypothetical protein
MAPAIISPHPIVFPIITATANATGVTAGTAADHKS